MIFDRLVCIGSWSKCIVTLSLMTWTVEAGFPDGICRLFGMSKWRLIFTIQPLRSAWKPLSSPLLTHGDYHSSAATEPSNQVKPNFSHVTAPFLFILLRCESEA